MAAVVWFVLMKRSLRDMLVKGVTVKWPELLSRHPALSSGSCGTLSASRVLC